MRVTLLSYTQDAEKLCAAAARSCYSIKGAKAIFDEISEEKATKAISDITGMGHHSVIEHASFTFSVEGVSRALTHQLVRHRIASYSQQSQRYVSLKDPNFVIPPSIIADKELMTEFEELMEKIWKCYEEFTTKVPPEDARYILPNACKTNITLTMNARELLHFFTLRCCNRCYDIDTEILTRYGWKRYDELTLHDECYSLNLETMESEYCPITRIMIMNYHGPMIHIDSQSINLVITPNHNVVVSYSYGKKRFELDKATNALNKKTVLMKKNCAPIKGKIEHFFIIPDLEKRRANQYCSYSSRYLERSVPISDFFKFLGMYISDGSVSYANHHFFVQLSEGNDEIARKYGEILERVTPNSVIMARDKSCWKICVDDRQLFEFLAPLGKAAQKHVPDFVWEYDSSILQWLYEGLCDGDMNKVAKGRQYSTISPKLAGDIQRLLLHLGHSGTITQIARDAIFEPLHDVVSRNGELRHIVHRSPELFVSINTSKNEPIIVSSKNDAFSMRHYDGKVFCVELGKNHTLYVRRFGRAVWSGNSQWEIREVADEMLRQVKSVSPRIFSEAGPGCVRGPCPEGKMTCGKPRRRELKNLK